MAILRIALVESDTLYAERLARCLSGDDRCRIQTAVFSDYSALKPWLDAPLPPDIILWGLPENQVSRSERAVWVRLSDNAGDGEWAYRVDKYQRTDILLEQVLDCLTRANPGKGEHIQKAAGTEVIAVYGPAGGSGATLISVALAAALDRAGSRVFYLNLEGINSSLPLVGDRGEKRFSEVLVAFGSPSESLSVRITKAKRTSPRYHFDYFDASDTSIELGLLGGARMVSLTNTLCGMGCYDAVVIDPGSKFDPDTLSILTMADRVVLLEEPSPVSRLKNTIFQEDLQRMGVPLPMLRILNRGRIGDGIGFDTVIPVIDEAIVTVPGGSEVHPAVIRALEPLARRIGGRKGGGGANA